MLFSINGRNEDNVTLDFNSEYGKDIGAFLTLHWDLDGGHDSYSISENNLSEQ